MKKWTYLYGENTIEVIYYPLRRHELYVNEQLQDEKTTFATDGLTLQGELESGEKIRATFNESSIVKCTLHVDNKLLKQDTAYPIEQKTTPMPTSQTPVREVTIIREIVKVPCSYCSQLVDVTADKCPNCGAKNVRYMI